MCEGREVISEEAERRSTLSKCLVTVLNGGKASIYVEINRGLGELRDQNMQCFLQTWSKIRQIREMEIKDLGQIKTNPRQLTVRCPGKALDLHTILCI